MTHENTIKGAVCAGLILLLGAGQAFAGDNGTNTIPLSITLTGVMETSAPLYISVQTEAEYRSMKGEGTILSQTSAGTVTEVVNLPAAGDYAVSIWHDLDNDGRFSMNDQYEIFDGWAGSGEALITSAPTFETAKITIPSDGAQTTIAMIYPNP